jgi:hypothetical protein
MSALPRIERKQEFTFSLTHANGGTEALTIWAWSYADAQTQIAQRYPGAKINWII